MTQLSGGDWLSAAEVADLLGLTRRRVNQFIQNGELPAQKTPLGHLVLRRDVVAFGKLDRPKPGRPKKKEGE